MQATVDFYRRVFQVETLFVSPGWTTLGFANFELALPILHEPAIEGSQAIEASSHMQV
jgi:hypothetical protein